MEIFNYLLSKKGKPRNVSDDLFSYLLGKNAGGGEIDIYGEGTTITLNGTANAPMRITLGSSALEQTTYIGKNLFNINATPSRVGGSTTYSVSGNELHITGQWFIAYQFNVSQNTDYYISATRNIISGASAGNIAIYNADVSTQIASVSKNDYSFNTGSYTTISVVLYAGSGSNGEVKFTNIQLETGSTKTAYEPYVGGTASPNPSYPQDIHTISGSNSIVVEGKNLIYEYHKSGNLIYLNGATRYEDYIFKAGTYTFSYKDTNNCLLTIKDTTGEQTSLGYAKVTTFTSNYDFNIWLYRSGITLEEVSEIQLEKGSTATTYEPYQSNTQTIDLTPYNLGSIGNYENRIFKNIPSDTDYSSEREEGGWYYKEGIGKVVLDGSENWGFSNAPTTPTNRTVLQLNNLIHFANTTYYSNYFVYGSQTSNRIILSGTNSIYISIEDSITGVTSEDTNTEKTNKVKTWLSNNNVTIYYALATTTYTKLTDTTLINQLENIYKNMLSYKGTTNISQVNNDLPFELKVVAKGKR